MYKDKKYLYKFGWFKLNLNFEKNNLHDYSHILFSFILAYFLGFKIAFIIMFLWEVADGFKPLWNSLPAKCLQNDIKFAKGFKKYWLKFIENTFYSDGFGVKDLLIFDLLGLLLGNLLK